MTSIELEANVLARGARSQGAERAPPATAGRSPTGGSHAHRLITFLAQASCLGNLLSALVLLLAYLFFELWRSYIPLILSAFLLSQALSRYTKSAIELDGRHCGLNSRPGA